MRHRADGPAHLRPYPARGFGREDQERAVGSGRPRVRALAPGHRELNMNLTLERADLIRAGNFIAGAWRLDPGAATLDVTDPSDHSLVGRVPDGGAAEARAAVDAAQAAFVPWKNRTARERAALLKRWN